MAMNFCLKFDYESSFKLILAPRDVIQVSQRILSLFWTIDEKYESKTVLDINIKKIPGRPDVSIEQFLCFMLQSYYEIGWSLKVSAVVDRYQSENSVLFFEKSNCATTNFSCLSIEAPNLVKIQGHSHLISIVRAEIIKAFTIVKESYNRNGYEVELEDKALVNYEDSSVIFMTNVLRQLYMNGWVYTAAIKNHSVDVLYFHFNPSKAHAKSSAFFAISLNGHDRLRLYNSPVELINAVPSLWSHEIQSAEKYSNAFEFKLKGKPWNSLGKNAEDTRVFICKLLSFLRAHNWKCYSVCRFASSFKMKNTFFFHYDQVNSVSPKRNTVCVSLNKYNKIQVTRGSDKIINTVRDAVKFNFDDPIMLENPYHESSYQFQLTGYPFSLDKTSTVSVFKMMMFMLQNLKRFNGLDFLCSADVCGEYGDKSNLSQLTLGDRYTISELHTWFFAAAC